MQGNVPFHSKVFVALLSKCLIWEFLIHYHDYRQLLAKVPDIFKTQVSNLVKIKSYFLTTGHTPAGPAISFLKSYGLEVALDNAGLIEKTSLDRYDLTVDDQDTVYLTVDEQKAEVAWWLLEFPSFSGEIQ